MKVQLLGAAQTVTGSCFVIESNKARFAVDCGMHQGNSEIEKRNYKTALYRASALDFILLTHAHIDHSGLLPRMVREKFTGPIYCTEPTLALLDIMLQDSAHIQEMEAEWANRKRARQGGKSVEALYTAKDAAVITSQLKPVRYNEVFEPGPGVRVCYRDAGHILGSAFLELEITEAEGVTRLIFSGDIGRPDALIVGNPATPVHPPDYLFLESTYGDREHKMESPSRDELAEAIRYSYDKGEKTIIPAFAVERTQEVIYELYMLSLEGRLPTDIPIYLDSPLAIKATEIFRQHPEYMDSSTRAFMRNGDNPFNLPGLTFSMSTKDSQEINTRKGPAIVISASGMCNAGRIKHHLRHNLWRPGASIVFTGYQAQGTPGRKIVDGAKTISMLGDTIAVAAKIFTIGGFSGHAGKSQLLGWVAPFATPELTVFLVHGEEKAQNILAEELRKRYGATVNIPSYLEELILAPGKAPLVQVDSRLTPQKVNWTLLLAETERKMSQLKDAAADMEKRPWSDQIEIRDRLLDLNKHFLQILSDI